MCFFSIFLVLSMSRRGGPKKKVKSESGAAVVAAPAAATPAAAAVVAAVVASSPSPAPAKKLRRRGSEIVYPPGRTVVVFSSLTYTPMLAYDCALLMDKGFVPSRWACARLHDEALYLETCKVAFDPLFFLCLFVLSCFFFCCSGAVRADVGRRFLCVVAIARPGPRVCPGERGAQRETRKSRVVVAGADAPLFVLCRNVFVLSFCRLLACFIFVFCLF
jgi:hypothetical protein